MKNKKLEVFEDQQSKFKKYLSFVLTSKKTHKQVVNVAMQLPMWAHPLLDQTQPHLDYLMEVKYERGLQQTETRNNIVTEFHITF